MSLTGRPRWGAGFEDTLMPGLTPEPEVFGCQRDRRDEDRRKGVDSCDQSVDLLCRGWGRLTVRPELVFVHFLFHFPRNFYRIFKFLVSLEAKRSSVELSGCVLQRELQLTLRSDSGTHSNFICTAASHRDATDTQYLQFCKEMHALLYE